MTWTTGGSAVAAWEADFPADFEERVVRGVVGAARFLFGVGFGAVFALLVPRPESLDAAGVSATCLPLSAVFPRFAGGSSASSASSSCSCSSLGLYSSSVWSSSSDGGWGVSHDGERTFLSACGSISVMSSCTRRGARTYLVLAAIENVGLRRGALLATPMVGVEVEVAVLIGS